MRTTMLLFVLAAGCNKTPANTTADVATQSSAEQETDDMIHLRLVDNFKRVHFDTDSAELDEDSKRVIAQNVEIMREHPLVEIIVVGHADERGDRAYNRSLGEERAQAVRAEMIAQGIGSHRVHLASHGEGHELTEMDTQRGWALDRRTEFIVLSDPFDQVDGSIDNNVHQRAHELRVE